MDVRTMARLTWQRRHLNTVMETSVAAASATEKGQERAAENSLSRGEREANGEGLQEVDLGMASQDRQGPTFLFLRPLRTDNEREKEPFQQQLSSLLHVSALERVNIWPFPLDVSPPCHSHQPPPLIVNSKGKKKVLNSASSFTSRPF